MPNTFISYRRDDSQDVVGRIYDHLVAAFPDSKIFVDVDSLKVGFPFKQQLETSIAKSDVALVIIGPDWLHATDGTGSRRLDSAGDFVRLEIEQALMAAIPIIPVLVSNASMPDRAELSGSLKCLPGLQGIKVRPDPDFRGDMKRLTKKLRAIVSPAGSSDPLDETGNSELELLEHQLETLVASDAPLPLLQRLQQEIDRRHGLDARLRQFRRGDTVSGRYHLIKIVGQGAFGTVWKVFDKFSRKHGAMKVLHERHRTEKRKLARFFRGARQMHSLSHPNIVRVLNDYGEDGGRHYFVMEFLEGGDFQQAVVDGLLTREETFHILFNIGAALEHAHQNGVIHRDVKPDNILLDDTGVAKLSDFDLVRALDTTRLTRTETRGSFVFSAPESFNAMDEVGPQADVYSLGMTALFSLYGMNLPMVVVRDAAAFIQSLNCNDSVKVVLERSLEWEPTDRYASCSKFTEALRLALEGRSAVRTRSNSEESWKHASRAQLTRCINLTGKLVNVAMLDGVLGAVTDEVARLINAQNVRLLLVDERREFGTRGTFGVATNRMNGGKSQALLDRSVEKKDGLLDTSTVEGESHSLLCVPLVNHEQIVLGAIQASDNTKQFSNLDLELVGCVANHLALALDFAASQDAVVRARVLERELHLAAEVQSAYVKNQTFPEVVGLDFAYGLEPANQAGGDYFGSAKLPDGRIICIVADVVGHGMSAALQAERLDALFGIIVKAETSPLEIMQRLNEELTGGPEGRFITAVLVVIDTDTWEVHIVNAGHMPPLLVDREGVVEELGANESGLPLLIMDEYEYQEFNTTLPPGAAILMHTDGLNESINADSEQYGMQRVLSTLSKNVGDASQVVRSLSDDSAAFRGVAGRTDDICIVCLARTNAD